MYKIYNMYDVCILCLFLTLTVAANSLLCLLRCRRKKDCNWVNLRSKPMGSCEVANQSMRTTSATYTFLGAYQMVLREWRPSLGAKPPSNIIKARIRFSLSTSETGHPMKHFRNLHDTHNEASLGSPPWIPLWTRPLNLMSHKKHQVDHV